MEKTVKKRRKKLIIFLCIVLSFCIGFHFLFEYFSNVVCENLKSVAQNTEYIESENDKVNSVLILRILTIYLTKALNCLNSLMTRKTRTRAKRLNLKKSDTAMLCGITINRPNFINTC